MNEKELISELAMTLGKSVEDKLFPHNTPNKSAYIVECMTKELEEAKRKVLKEFSIESVIRQTVQDNNLEMYKEIVKDHKVSYSTLAPVIAYRREDMFKYAIETHDLSSEYPRLFNLCISHECMASAKLILDSEKNKPNYDVILRDLQKALVSYCKNSNSEKIRDLFSMMGSHLEVNDNLEHLSNTNFLDLAIYSKDIETCKFFLNELNFDLYTNKGNEFIQAANIYVDCTDSDKNTTLEILNIFLYDRKIEVTPEMLKKIKKHKNFECYDIEYLIEKRDLFFSLNENLDNKQKPLKRKL